MPSFITYLLKEIFDSKETIYKININYLVHKLRLAKYNLPDNVMLESAPKKQIDSSQVNSKDKILNSKLPDEIKRLMIEHPIHQPKQSTSTLSNDLIDKAARLMNVDASGKKTAPLLQKEQFSDSTNLKELIKEIK